MKIRLLCLMLMGTSMLISNQLFSQGRREMWKERKEKIQEDLEKIREIRKLGQEFRKAVINGEEQKSQELLSSMKEKFNALPESLKNRIEEKHPGTIERVKNLSVEDVDKNIHDDYSEITDSKLQQKTESKNISTTKEGKT
ncbi:MAG TPA: hypothetical protein P5239_10605, partial [Victivallales bacterium]|nr:hypothetical protein [Victivallales bacterium]